MKRKYEETIKQPKGVAGLNIFLAIIAMLFMIGILIMVFILAGSQLSEQIGDRVTSQSGIENETITMLNQTAVATTVASLRSPLLTNIIVTNETDGALVTTGNYSESAGYFTATAINELYISPVEVNVSFNYSYLADNTASASIIDTTEAIGTATEWFSTFITLAALVVLVLLVVIIINSIRGAGIMGGA